MSIQIQVSMPLRIRQSTECSDCSHRTMRMFCNMGEEALARFDKLGLHLSLPSRVSVFEEGQPVNNVFVVCTGRLKLSSTSAAGKGMILRLAGPGDVLGLSAALTEQPYEVTAETLEPTELKTMKRSEFLALFQDFSEVGQKAARVAAAEYRTAYLDARRLAISGSASAKLAQLLLEWARSGPCESQNLRLTMTLTHEELASMCGLSRETVTRLLNQFEKDGVIERRGAHILIPQPKALESIAG